VENGYWGGASITKETPDWFAPVVGIQGILGFEATKRVEEWPVATDAAIAWGEILGADMCTE
jgi:hypothetical protein